MKHAYLLFIAFLFVTHLNSQTCLPDGIEFTTQSMIDNFATDYPGCTVIEGNVLIDGETNTTITSLSGLSVLTAINGKIDIRQNDALVSLTGLEGLTTFGEQIVKIENNDGLIDLTGLNNLTSINGTFQVRYNKALTSLAGLEKLTSIEKLVLGSNDVLENINALANLTTIETNLSLNSNASLINLSGLENLNSVGGVIEIWYNNSLTSIAALSQLTSIGSHLYLTGNSSLTSLDGLHNITSIGGIFKINSNDGLTNLSPLANLTSIGSHLEIYGNDGLTNFTGLEGLTTLPSNLVVVNSNITSLFGLHNITSIGGDVYLGAYPSSFGIFGGYGNPKLTSLNDLSNLTEIGKRLWITANDLLVDLEGLQNVTTLGRGIYIGALPNSYARGNAALTSIAQLSGITMIDGDIEIERNPVLASLNGIGQIDHTGISELRIVENDTLAICGVTSICNFLSDENNTATIELNEINCNDVAEVLSTCMTSSIEDVTDNSQSISPNPTTGMITLDRHNNEPFKVINTIGQVILEGYLTTGRIDLTNCKNGLYFIEITNELNRTMIPVSKQSSLK